MEPVSMTYITSKQALIYTNVKAHLESNLPKFNNRTLVKAAMENTCYENIKTEELLRFPKSGRNRSFKVQSWCDIQYTSGSNTVTF